MRIAIVVPNASPLVAPSEGRKIGGLETFAWNLARGLAMDGRDEVFFLVRSKWRRLPEVFEKVLVGFFHEPMREIRQSVSNTIEFAPGSRIPRFKNFSLSQTSKITLLAIRKLVLGSYNEHLAIQSALDKFHPDQVITLGVNQTSAGLGQYALRRGVPVVLWLQSNADLQLELYENNEFIDRYGVSSSQAKSCLEACRNVICQTSEQTKSLELINSRHFPHLEPLHSICIPNPVATDLFHPHGLEAGARNGVLWIGRADRFHKRPLLAIEISKRCPNQQFLMILNPSDDLVAREVKLNKPPNVELIDYVPAAKMPFLMRSSRLFLSTGSAAYEGFPNVLLEAAASGTPIVSLEDFDGFLSREGCGLSGNMDQVVAHIKRLSDDAVEWENLSQMGTKCVRTKHQMDTVINAFRGFQNASTNRAPLHRKQ